MVAPDQITITHQDPMTTNYRTLCAEMLSGWQEGRDIVGLMNRARAALKVEPEAEVAAQPASTATSPAPEPGEVDPDHANRLGTIVPSDTKELAVQLDRDGVRLIEIGYANESLLTRDTGIRVVRAATLLQQQFTELAALRGVAVAVEALTRLYWWGGMSGNYGYSSDVVIGVRDWINSGMVGGLPPLPAWIADRCPPLPAPQAGEVQS